MKLFKSCYETKQNLLILSRIYFSNNLVHVCGLSRGIEWFINRKGQVFVQPNMAKSCNSEIVLNVVFFSKGADVHFAVISILVCLKK